MMRQTKLQVAIQELLKVMDVAQTELEGLSKTDLAYSLFQAKSSVSVFMLNKAASDLSGLAEAIYDAVKVEGFNQALPLLKAFTGFVACLKPPKPRPQQTQKAS